MLAAALERAPAEPNEHRASALVGAALLAFEQGDYADGVGLAENGLACALAAGSDYFEAVGHTLLATVSELGRAEQIRHIEEAIDLARAAGDRWLLGCAIGNYGSVMIQFGDSRKAVELTEEAYRICRGVGDVVFSAGSLNNLGWIALEEGDTVEARSRMEEAFELAELIDDSRMIGSLSANLGWVELLEGNLERAWSCFEDAARVAGRVVRRPFVSEAIWGLAQVAAASGDAFRAARLAGAASAIGLTAGYDPTKSLTRVHHVQDIRATTSESAWQKPYDEGAELGLDAALALALER
jgi:tetratricopeptide (TPR) repeat protein